MDMNFDSDAYRRALRNAARSLETLRTCMPDFSQFDHAIRAECDACDDSETLRAELWEMRRHLARVAAHFTRVTEKTPPAYIGHHLLPGTLGVMCGHCAHAHGDSIDLIEADDLTILTDPPALPTCLACEDPLIDESYLTHPKTNALDAVQVVLDGISVLERTDISRNLYTPDLAERVASEYTEALIEIRRETIQRGRHALVMACKGPGHLLCGECADDDARPVMTTLFFGMDMCDECGSRLPLVEE